MIYFEFCGGTGLGLVRSNINSRSEEFQKLLNYLKSVDERGYQVVDNFGGAWKNNSNIALMSITCEYIKDFCTLMNWEWREVK